MIKRCKWLQLNVATNLRLPDVFIIVETFQ